MHNQKWTAIWGSSPSITFPHAERYAKDITLRFPLRTLLSGKKVRIHLSNFGGKEVVAITRVYVAHLDENDIADQGVPVLFNGKEGVTIPAGEAVVSDETDFELVRNTDYAVSLYLGEITPMASGTNDFGPLCHFAFAEGDHAASSVLPAAQRVPIDTAFFLTGVDALTDGNTRAAVCFGDSITAQYWPDYLALRLEREGDGTLSVIRRGIGGSRVLRAYTHVQHRHYGPNGKDRFEREVTAAGADRVFILHGINDIIHPDGSQFRPWSDLPTAEELIEGLTWYVEKSHELGLKVYLCTIHTIKGWSTFIPEREVIRKDVNTWIRSQNIADGIVDFDAVTRDASDPDARDPRYDVGDHLHPSKEGARVMAESVPAEYLK